MSSPSRVLVFVPMYNCEKQIPRVLAQFTPEVARQFARVLVIDNRSTDRSAEVAAPLIERMQGIEALLVRNRENYGLGGSHKVGFRHALEHRFDRVAVLHGDDQGSIAELAERLASGEGLRHEAFLGARFMPGSRLPGYSTFRTLGNRAFNLLFSVVLGRRIHDLGSGLNLYDTSILRDAFYHRFPDDLTFNYCMVMAHAHYRHDFAFFPISWREDDQVSNVRLFRQARKVLRMLASYALTRSRFLGADLRQRPQSTYDCDVIASNFGR